MQGMILESDQLVNLYVRTSKDHFTMQFNPIGMMLEKLTLTTCNAHDVTQPLTPI